MGLNQIFTIFGFLPLFFLVYYLSPIAWKRITILLFSLVFYFLVSGNLIIALLVSATFNFFSGLLLKGKFKRATLIISLLFNVGLLFFYKYLFTLIRSINEMHQSILIPHQQEWVLHSVIMPAGISYFTFRSISYLMDVYRGKTEPERNFTGFLGWFAFFPVILAGPVSRFQELISQISAPSVSIQGVSEGMERFILGLSKKVILAGSLSYITKLISEFPVQDLSTPLLWLGNLAYFLEIYYDFSGYSDMAIGLGLMMGIRIQENFNFPYAAVDIRDFWRRWHISLSTWLRDYLFLPLAWLISKKMPDEKYFNLKTDYIIYVPAITVTFALCGIWHGPAMNFLVWGIYFAFFLALEQVWLGRKLKKIWKPLRHLYTLSVVFVSWLIFKATSWEQLVLQVSQMINWSDGTPSVMSYQRYFLMNAQTILVLTTGLIFVFPVYPAIKKYLTRKTLKTPWLRSTIEISGLLLLGILFIISISYLIAGNYQPSIYFRF